MNLSLYIHIRISTHYTYRLSIKGHEKAGANPG